MINVYPGDFMKILTRKSFYIQATATGPYVIMGWALFTFLHDKDYGK